MSIWRTIHEKLIMKRLRCCVWNSKFTVFHSLPCCYLAFSSPTAFWKQCLLADLTIKSPLIATPGQVYSLWAPGFEQYLECRPHYNNVVKYKFSNSGGSGQLVARCARHFLVSIKSTHQKTRTSLRTGRRAAKNFLLLDDRLDLGQKLLSIFIYSASKSLNSSVFYRPVSTE